MKGESLYVGTTDASVLKNIFVLSLVNLLVKTHRFQEPTTHSYVFLCNYSPHIYVCVRIKMYVRMY